METRVGLARLLIPIAMLVATAATTVMLVAVITTLVATAEITMPVAIAVIVVAARRMTPQVTAVEATAVAVTAAVVRGRNPRGLGRLRYK